MSEFEIIEETPVSLAELKEALKALQTEEALPFRVEKTNVYLENFVSESTKDVKQIETKIRELNILRLKDRHIVKIVDVMPKDMDSLKMLLSTETLTIKDEDLKKILDVIPQ